MSQAILFTRHVNKTVDEALSQYNYDKLFVLTDTNTRQYALPLLGDSKAIKDATVITIEADDTHKNIDTLCAVWLELSTRHATRKSFLINLGGGMVTDLGGFAASTFKRGIRYINIPTTLLGAIDAAVGGKTGINFNGLKNEIGAFNPALAVIISTRFFATLSRENLLSGYAEMLKHGLISNPAIYNKLLDGDLSTPDLDQMLQLIKESVNVKEEIVKNDPFEKNIRKSLNLGHTVGHAFESLSHERKKPVAHGYAVAWGLICELLISHFQVQFPIDTIRQLARFVYENYGAFPITCDDYDHLYELMTHDKKNDSEAVNFTLLADIGDVKINQTANRSEIGIAFDLYRELFHM
ncbi:3-dehydroquinate synthase [Coprobacter tertius]|uniref:3-dehydroquinate synthase n=1 Tax=Coprobacter tertius TaxID=2944915 RepID=A0ABT1MIQ9_9BACT|nr:3-dehydroquinate synthase [Coprobacter tertius]MCP9612269.1 3-dehydroquinate synthase [Coprobacter tertius]